MPEVIMPRLSDTMEEGELTRWLKNVGDEIHKGDVLAEIETDKATMDLEAFENGILEEILVAEGTLVPIGAPVARIGDGSGGAGVAPAQPTPAEAAEPTEQAPAEPAPGAAEPAPAAAAAASADKTAPEAEEAPVIETESAPVSAPSPNRPRTSPLARKIARDHGIDLSSLTGSGPQGRIVRADVEAAISAAVAAPSTAAAPAQSEHAAAQGTDVEEVPINNIRKVTARRLTESQAVPHFFLTSVVSAEALIGLRADINAGLAASGRKVSINDLIVKACAVALSEHPNVNSSWGGDKLLRHKHINVGVAVALENGLIVPVITDADQKSLPQIAAETVTLATRARDGKLAPAQFSGGTFTVSNLGMFGINQFTAVINPPEAAILAVGAATDEPAVQDGKLVTVKKMAITLTVDHRVLDGASAAAFLRDLTGILENPLRILL